MVEQVEYVAFLLNDPDIASKCCNWGGVCVDERKVRRRETPYNPVLLQGLQVLQPPAAPGATYQPFTLP